MRILMVTSFPVPGEPLIAARGERLLALGEEPFTNLFLPEAVLLFRQGLGRLIRSLDDRHERPVVVEEDGECCRVHQRVQLALEFGFVRDALIDHGHRILGRARQRERLHLAGREHGLGGEHG